MKSSWSPGLLSQWVKILATCPGQKTKNLFICDNKGKQHFLVTIPDEKSVDLKLFSEALGVKKLRFASANRLQKHLKLEPGAVTILGVMNDDDLQVRVVVDQAIWEADAYRSRGAFASARCSTRSTAAIQGPPRAPDTSPTPSASTVNTMPSTSGPSGVTSWTSMPS